MAALLPRSQPKWWWPYFLLVIVVLFIIWKLAPGGLIGALDRLSPFHIGTPQISGTVVDALTGRPLPRMDVCLLLTYRPVSFEHRRGTDVMRSATTRTDTSGTFSFSRWDSQLDLFDDRDGYGIAVTDPAAQWKDVCGRDTYLLGAGITYGHNNVFQMETYFQSHSDSATKTPPYFPVAMVMDPDDPHPLVYGLAGFFDYFPPGTLIRKIGGKIGDPSKLKVAMVPLLHDANECRSAPDPDSLELCRQMNQSLTADTLRASWKISPQGR